MFVNLTPHKVVIVNSNSNSNSNIEIEPSGNIARCKQISEKIGDIDGIEIVKTVFGEIEGLPEEVEGIYYIVSGLVRSATFRKDVFSPGDLVRNKLGEIIGCKCLIGN